MATDDNSGCEENGFKIEDQIVNPEDGLGLLGELGENDNQNELLIDTNVLENSTSPKQSNVLIITNLAECIFTDVEKKVEF